MPIVSGLLGNGTPAVHQGYEKARTRILPTASASTLTSSGAIATGDFIILDSNGRANPSGSTSAISASLQGASFLGISQDTSPTIDPYHTVIIPSVTVLIGGIALCQCASTTWKIGQLVYLDANTKNLVNSSANGTAIGVVQSAFGTSLGADFYASAVTAVYVELAHPGFPV